MSGAVRCTRAPRSSGDGLELSLDFLNDALRAAEDSRGWAVRGYTFSCLLLTEDVAECPQEVVVGIMRRC